MKHDNKRIYNKNQERVKAARTGGELRLDLKMACFRATASAKACEQLTKANWLATDNFVMG